MFTGIVEEIGRVSKLKRNGTSIALTVRARTVLRGLRKGDSISVNGVCLTVTEKGAGRFAVQAVEETLRKTNLGTLREGSAVNLERSILPNSRMGGHFVLGHVDTTGRIESIKNLKSSRLMWISVSKRFAKLLIPVGSVAIDGVSLTVARLETTRFAVSLIPYTLKVTTLGRSRIGDRVNIEFDVLGKYVQRMIGRK
ncbi:MAG TPA: riboflavin synthase [Bacteroidota bacterium]|nr:riboflavin synthase [Bacteroidota bacterium]